MAELKKIFTCPSTSGLTDSVTDMFKGTGGSFTGDPVTGKSYYYGEDPDVPSDDPNAKYGSLGGMGAGVAYRPQAAAKLGLTAMSGANDPQSPNFGNFTDPNGSVFVCIPRMWYKVDTVNRNAAFGNKPNYYVSYVEKEGYIPFYAFKKSDGTYVSEVFVAKYQMSNSAGFDVKGGKAVYVKNGSPTATIGSGYSDHSNNLIGNLTANGISPGNTNEGFFEAPKTCGLMYSLHYAALRFVYYVTCEAHMQECVRKYGSIMTVPSEVCAFLDVAPYFPKGNNNGSLGDVNDTSIKYETTRDTAYIRHFAKTGSCNYPAKVSHNGQECGIMDLNGNMCEVDAGYENIGGTHYALKGIDLLQNLRKSNHTQTSFYTSIRMTNRKDTKGHAEKWGNLTNPVFSFAADDANVLADNFLIPLANGTSSTGTDEYGLDRYFTPRQGEAISFGGEVSGADAGLLYVESYESGSWAGGYSHCGARAILVSL